MSKVWVISDYHFSHWNIVRLCGRPFKTVEEMDETLIALHNERVAPEDTVWFLGDFSYAKYDEALKIFNRLNGIKHLILGNHDQVAEKLPWASIQHYKEIKHNGKTVVLFHFPIIEWSGYFRGAYHLYGHIHGNDAWERHGGKRPARAADVGWDSKEFPCGPYDLDVVLDNLETDYQAQQKAKENDNSNRT